MTTTIQEVDAFELAHSNGNGGYKTAELANEYALLYRNWWGSNLVYLGCTKHDDNYFYPEFNVWD